MYIRFEGRPWCECSREQDRYWDAREDDPALVSVRCGVSAEEAPRFVADLKSVFPSVKIEVVDAYCPTSAANEEARMQRSLDEDPDYQRRRRDRRIAQLEAALLVAGLAIPKWPDEGGENDEM